MIPIKYCKICFQRIDDFSFSHILSKSSCICEKCFGNFKPRYIHFDVIGVKALSIYEYDQNIKDLLFKFKGCFDIELVNVFFDRCLWYLKLRYIGYHIIPIPSYHLDDEKRGFNHVQQLYSGLNLPMLNIVKKVKNVKQANLKKKDREKTDGRFEINDYSIIKNKKILIVDDVCTTGSSLKAIIKLVRKGKPKKIEVLVMAKNVLKPIKKEYKPFCISKN